VGVLGGLTMLDKVAGWRKRVRWWSWKLLRSHSWLFVHAMKRF